MPFFAVKEIHWDFDPASAPHFDGVSERLIRSFKDSMYSVIGSKTLTDVILLTVFAEVESFLNTRPLTYVSADPEDFDLLTTNHFFWEDPN